jgi:hypothetical protein
MTPPMVSATLAGSTSPSLVAYVLNPSRSSWGLLGPMVKLTAGREREGQPVESRNSHQSRAASEGSLL